MPGLRAALALLAVIAIAAGAPAKEPVTWKHGIATARGDAGFHVMAHEKGFWTTHGLHVTFVPSEDGASRFRSLLAGEVDTIEVSPTDIFSVASVGGDLKIVGATIAGMSHVLYVKRDITSVKDLAGKKIGISVPGALPQVLVQAYLMEHGLSPTGAHWVNAGDDAARVKALLAGTIDAAAAAPDAGDPAPVVTRAGSAKVLVKFNEVLPKYVRFVLITTDRTIRERPDTVAAFLLGYARGIRYAIGHRDETIALTRKVTKADAGDPAPAFVYDTYVRERLLAPDLAVSEDQIAWMQSLNMKLGKQTAAVPVRRVLDLRFQQQVIAKLGAYTW